MSQRRKPKGITAKQAKFLADLQRRVGEPYSGNGMTAYEAGVEIGRLLGKPWPSTIYQRARAAVATQRQREESEEAKAREDARRKEARAERERIARANAVPTRAGRDGPTPGQLHDLAVLARRAGETPPQPSHRGDAVRELARLRSASP